MSAHRGKLANGGRLQVPAPIRRQLGIADGDTILISVIDGELRIRPLHDAVSRVQSRLQAYLPRGVSLSDELIADRRKAARDE